MYVNLHDYSGHPFQVELSRELARRGHRIDHTYCVEYLTGRGRLIIEDSDPRGLRIVPLRVGRELMKYEALSRLRFELSYARRWSRFVRANRYDLIVMCNVPLFSLALMQRTLRRLQLPWVLWHQDIYSTGVAEEAKSRLAIGSGLVSLYATWLERQQVRSATGVIPIAKSFVDRYKAWGLDTSHISVVPNWAPLGEIRPLTRDNEWASEQMLEADSFRILYSGTLGRKHNPKLLLRLLDEVQASGIRASLIVCSEGVGADDLRSATVGRGDVRILAFQRAERLAEVLSSGDVVVALLEPTASQFSVPSKVSSYLSAGRPVVGLMPLDNPAAADIRAAAGCVASPDPDGVSKAAAWITEVAGQPSTLRAIGMKARAYAESRFDIQAIADQFEEAFERAAARACR